MGGAKKTFSKANKGVASFQEKTNAGTQLAKKNKKIAELENQVKKINGGMGFKDPSQAVSEMLANPSKFKNQWSEIFGFGGIKESKPGPNTGPVDAKGNPIKIPKYESILDKNGMLNKNYRAMDTAPWLQMQLQREDLERGNLIDQGNQKSLSAMSGALSNLASTGGLRSGSRERIARQGIKDQALAMQGVNLQSGLNKLNIQSDAFDKAQAARAQDIAYMTQDKTLKNAGEMFKYGEQMKGWAAGKQGDAIAKSGKK